MDIKGSCNCGGVMFKIGTPVSDVYVCHCSICRKSTGSGGIAVAIVSDSDFSWTRGSDLIKTWAKPDSHWQAGFCANCGSPLPGENSDNTVYFPVSLLDSDNENLRVQHHFYIGSKGSWEEIGDEGIQHQEGFESPDA